MGIVDLAYGYSYAQRYQRKVAASDGIQQAGGVHTLSSSSEDSVQHLARLTQQLSKSTNCSSLGNTQHARSQSSSINNARTTSTHQAARLPSADASNQTARLPLIDVCTHINRPKQRLVSHKHHAAKPARLSLSIASKTAAGNSGRAPNQQKGLISADSNTTIAAQRTHATTTAHDWPSVKLTVPPAQSPASLTSPKARGEPTSELPAAMSMDSLAAKPLSTPHVDARLAAAAAAVSEPAAAASTSGCTAAESESQHAAAESEPQHAAAEASSSLITAAGTVAVQPQSAGARSAAEPDNRRPTGSKEGQVGLPPTTALVQAEMPLVKALVQSSGTGCGGVLQISEERAAVGRVRQRDSWVSRSFRGKAQSSCTLQLLCKIQHGVSIRVAFLDAAHTPLEAAFAHTGSLSKSWQQLGSMQLSRDDRQQLQHVFRLGAKHSIQRYLHISFSGHLLGCTSGSHSVRKLSVTAPTWVPAPHSMLASDSASPPCTIEQTFHQQQQQQLVQQDHAGARLERQGLGREVTAETVSASSAASSCVGSTSAAAGMSRLTCAGEGNGNGEMHSRVSAGKSKLVQGDASDAALGLQQDRAAGVQAAGGDDKRHSVSSTPLLALGRLQLHNQQPEDQQARSSFARAAAQLAAVEVAAASNSSSPCRAARDTLSGLGRLHSGDAGSHHLTSLIPHPREHNVNPWRSQMDAESPSIPASPRADANSPPFSAEDLLTCEPQGLMHATQEPCQGQAAGQQPEQATVDWELMTHPSSEDADASHMAVQLEHHKHAVHVETEEQRHHSTGSRHLKMELAAQHQQAVSAGKQLQQQLQESQQHLLYCQENHKQRIAAVFDQAVKSEVSDQHVQAQGHQQGAKLAVGHYEGSSDPSMAEMQDQQQQLLQVEYAKQAKRAQQRQKAGPKPNEPQDAVANRKSEAGCNLNSRYNMGDVHPGGNMNRQRNVLSSVDMNALLDRVAKEALPQDLHADDPHPHAMSNSLPDLLRPSNTLVDALLAPIPDPFLDKQVPCTHADPATPQRDGDLHALDSVCARAYEASTRATWAQSEGLIRASSPTMRARNLCQAPDRVASHSEEAHAEAAACQARKASVGQSHLNANCSNSVANSSSSSATKHVAADVGSRAPAAITDPEAQGSSMDAAAAMPAAQDLRKPQQRLNHACGSVESLHSGFKFRPVLPAHSQEPSHLHKSKQRMKQEVHPDTLKTSNSSSAAATLTSSWPRVSHVSKLRHGEQLRQAAAEAAAAAAGQAARAESAVRLHTPPTIAFHSAAAKHAMLAAETAAADAAVTANSTVVVSPQHWAGHCKAQLLGWAGQLPALALRGGTLHASAPASPVQGSERHSSVLQANQGLLDMMDMQYARRSRDSADVCVSDDAHAQHQHACKGQSFDMHGLLGKDPLLRTASAPATPVITRAAEGTARRQQQLHVVQEPSLSHDSSRLLADAQRHHMPQKQSMHGRKMEACAPHRDQQAQHAQQATWEQEGMHPMEDPFKVSEQFPICPELCLPLPSSGKHDSQQACLLTDCTNQLAGHQNHHCRTGRPSPSFHSLQMQLPSRPDVAETSGLKGSMRTQQRIYQKGDRSRCEQALSMQAEVRGAEPATELLSSLTEDDFWEAARAELLDTAEPVRHRSCVGELDSSCPITMRGLPMDADEKQHTPQPRLCTGPISSSGISPLLGLTWKKPHSDHCWNTLQIEDTDDPLKADWGL